MDIIIATAQDKRASAWQSALQKQLPDAHIRLLGDGSSADQARYALVWQPPATLFQQAPGLEYLFNLGAGVDALVTMPDLPDEVRIVRLEDAGMGVQIAEYVLYHLLRESRHFARYERQRQERHWHVLPAIERSAWPVGIMGAGVIGLQIAQACAALQYPVAVWSRRPQKLQGMQHFHGAQGFKHFLERTRVLVNALPLTPQTQGILGLDTFKQLLPDACLINIGRGAHLHAPDLIPALDAGCLRSATLDVFEPEPLPADHPFWADARIHVTPHISGSTLVEPAARQIAAKILQLEEGQEITGVVDRQQKY